MMSSKAALVEISMIQCHSELYASLLGEIDGQVLKKSGQILFYDVLITILLKIICPSLLQQKHFLLLSISRDNPGFPTPVLGELDKPGNSSCC